MAKEPLYTPHPKSAPGDFYVMKDMCLSCGVPQAVAPDLMGWTDPEAGHCIWKKQPETQQEWEQAIAVLKKQELGCHRYAGTDPAVLSSIPSECCDYPFTPNRPFRAEYLVPTKLFEFAYPQEREAFFIRLWKQVLGWLR